MKKIEIKFKGRESFLDRLGKKWIKYLPHRITGSTEYLLRQWHRVYGEKNGKDFVENIRTDNTKKMVLAVILISILLILGALSEFTQESAIQTDKYGRFYIKRPDTSQGTINIEVKVEGNANNKTVGKSYILPIYPENYFEKNKQEMKNEKKYNDPEMDMDFQIYHISRDDKGKYLILPNSMGEVRSIKWQEKKEYVIVKILIIGIFVLLSLYGTRYGKVKKLIKASEMSVKNELPDFLSKMTLMMNAGLVFTSAFEKIVNEYDENKNANRKNENYFYEQLSEICKKSGETKSPVIFELKQFAERTENREFIRCIYVISDNINKGTSLVETVENESNFMWFQSKKNIEERGKLAETKLVVPMALQLLALLIITIAPALYNI